jgi:diadenosine tetraphosphate (Ap4A) HIT family hydrolase
MEDPNDCFICRKQSGAIAVAGGVIYEDDLVYAGHAGMSEDPDGAYLGYLMAEPRRHVRGLADLSDTEAGAMGRLVTRLSGALVGALRAEHVYSFVLGHHVPHLHVHVVPRYPGAPEEYWGTRVDEWPDAPRGGGVEIAEVCDRLREHLGVSPG